MIELVSSPKSGLIPSLFPFHLYYFSHLLSLSLEVALLSGKKANLA